ncbi:FtsW/RodA/SpoVE family cell cycle protein [uncultured Faecalibaculum sp.]|uniref:FtsW/RodA/SpoVE family cell cycle protein n=1 Tax=uncultured Faecalibaculum sp. TaxID=1729681 RepID=UPI0025D17E9B|nr:FtsW/RodA/SpoVE family cell cycle protein [uncultured Faecalibaculum sp.]
MTVKHTIHMGKWTLRMDFGLVAILLLMGATSCFALYNAFNLIRDGSGMSNLIKQIFWYCVGFAVMFVIASLNRKTLFKLIHKAYTVLMICLLYLLASSLLFRFTGHSLPFSPWINGAFSWFRLGGLGFQPSEFIKIVLIVMVSEMLSGYWRTHAAPTIQDDWHLLLRIARIALPPLVLIFLQPDTGVCIIIGFTLLVLILCSGLRKEYIWAVAFLTVAVLGLFFYLYFFQRDLMISVFSAYRLQRIDAWLDPESHILGSSNQLYTSLLSLGSAGLTGYGLQANIIAIPEAHTDFIFAAFGQCFGLLGTVFILGICLILDLYLCKIAYNMKRLTDRYITIGVIAMLLYQQIQNLGMIVGLIPITGVTLPLISYGGSSIVSYFIAFGLILRASPNAKKEYRIGRKKQQSL